MTPLLFAALAVFVLAMVHAMVINGWRMAINAAASEENAALPADPPMITAIVPVRNGAATLLPLLQDLYAQRYPRERTEVIVIDDHSEDGTAELVRSMMPRWPQLRLVTLTLTKGKKAAITEGVRQAQAELILATDADVRCGPDRLGAVVAQWRKTGAYMILMPVHTHGRGFLGALQEEEQFAFLGATAGSAIDGSPMLANGANMAFAKQAFEAVRGYEGDRRASGDDLFLLARMKKAGRRVVPLIERSAVVEAQSELTWCGFFAQRLRWAGKMWAMAGSARWVGAFAVLLPYAIAAVTIWAVNSFRFGQGMERTWLLLLASWALWIAPVVALINSTKRKLGVPRRSVRSLLALPVFLIYSLPIAIASVFVRPAWKGRSA